MPNELSRALTDSGPSGAGGAAGGPLVSGHKKVAGKKFTNREPSVATAPPTNKGFKHGGKPKVGKVK
jgi:hypothetical protein